MTIVIAKENLSSCIKTLELCVPYLVFHPSDSQPHCAAKFVQDFLAVVNTNPERLLFITAYHDQSLVGFMIATSEFDHVFIAQIWSHHNNPPEIANSMFLRALIWACALGKPSVRAETNRNLEVLHRRVGLKPRSTIVERQIDPGMLDKFISCSQEYLHG